MCAFHRQVGQSGINLSICQGWPDLRVRFYQSLNDARFLVETDPNIEMIFCFPSSEVVPCNKNGSPESGKVFLDGMVFLNYFKLSVEIWREIDKSPNGVMRNYKMNLYWWQYL